MMLHTLTVRPDRTACVRPLGLVAGTHGTDAVALDLPAEWEGLDVSVSFEGSGAVVAPAPLADGTWPVPWEVVAKPGAVRVRVEGRRDGILLAHALTDAPMRAAESGAPVDASSPTDPTESELQGAKREALAAAGEARDAAERALAARITSAVAETLPPGSAATAEAVGNTLRLGIPQGEKGERGDADFGILYVEGGDLYAAYTSEVNDYEFTLDGADLEVSLNG